MKGLHRRTCDNCGAIIWADEEISEALTWDSYATEWTFYEHENDIEEIGLCPGCGAGLEEDTTTEREE